MTIKEVQERIMRLKTERDVCILAHSYQSREIIEIADFSGDSYQLSVAASTVPNKTVVMCGVRFMAETVKILSPQKTVILAHPNAGCPMAEQMSVEYINTVKRDCPDHAVVAYINTTAALKTVCDVCVTSSSAVKIVEKLPQKDILFIPDCNLGAYVAAQCPDKNVKLLEGGCPVHVAVYVEDVRRARAAHPDALLLVHPECTPQVLAQADFVGSTSAIMDYAGASHNDEFIIGTEMSIVQNLQYSHSYKKFYPLSHKLICPDMRITSLVHVLQAVQGTGGEAIELDSTTITEARACIDRMIEYGG
ncbi:MAG: quinolinate synthase NadA [Oscillospiraceae bacterium]|nr:quinolinate synthase NadA [Oscillospiraceae bacterium]